MNKEQLYESIMHRISKEVLNIINENAPFKQGKTYSIICDANDKKQIQSIFDDAEKEVIENAESEYYTVEVESEEEITLAGITGYINGTIEYYASISHYRNSDDFYHSWIESEITDVEVRDYDLTLYDEESDMEYSIYLDAKDAPKSSNIEDTEVKRKYTEYKNNEYNKRLQQQHLEQQKQREEYVAKVKADPNFYIKYAEDLLKSAEDNYLNWSDGVDAEDIFKILDMPDKAKEAHSAAVYGYHREEAAAGLI